MINENLNLSPAHSIGGMSNTADQDDDNDDPLDFDRHHEPSTLGNSLHRRDDVDDANGDSFIADNSNQNIIVFDGLKSSSDNEDTFNINKIKIIKQNNNKFLIQQNDILNHHHHIHTGSFNSPYKFLSNGEYGRFEQSAVDCRAPMPTE